MTLNASGTVETRLSGQQSAYEFSVGADGPYTGESFCDPHSSSRGEYRTPHEDFTGISRLLSDTVQMIPALTDWIVASAQRTELAKVAMMELRVSVYGPL